MIPKLSDDFNYNSKTITYPSLTYKISDDGKRIYRKTDGMEALKQAIVLILGTERYDYLIYSWNYGAELSGKMGSNMQLSCLMLKNAICEALLQDDRIESVDNFKFQRNKKKLHISFTVHSVLGRTESEVTLDV